MHDDYIHPDWRAVLGYNGLSSFDQLWNLQAHWVETPNAERGGASGASRLVLRLPDESSTVVYLKRQSGHTRPSMHHPLRGEPTFAREYAMLLRLRENSITAPLPVFYGEKIIAGKLCAILVTEDLAGYLPLDEFVATLPRLPRTLITSVARTVRAMHALGIQHRSLYPKHIFVKPDGYGYDVALIDLEKSRRGIFPAWLAILDLSTLDYRGLNWRQATRLFFFKQYHGNARLNWWQELQCYFINKRSASRLKNIGNHGQAH